MIASDCRSAWKRWSAASSYMPADQLQGNLAMQWRGLFREPHLSHAAASDFLDQPVVSDRAVQGRLWCFSRRGYCEEFRSSDGQKFIARLHMMSDERFHFGAQLMIRAAGRVQIAPPFLQCAQ